MARLLLQLRTTHIEAVDRQAPEDLPYHPGTTLTGISSVADDPGFILSGFMSSRRRSMSPPPRSASSTYYESGPPSSSAGGFGGGPYGPPQDYPPSNGYYDGPPSGAPGYRGPRDDREGHDRRYSDGRMNGGGYDRR